MTNVWINLHFCLDFTVLKTVYVLNTVMTEKVISIIN